jgi:hypothetical protein
MNRNEYPIALAIEDQYFLSRLLLGAPCEIDPEQVSRLFADGLIERAGKRWKLSAAGRELLGEGPSSIHRAVDMLPGALKKADAGQLALTHPVG